MLLKKDKMKHIKNYMMVIAAAVIAFGASAQTIINIKQAQSERILAYNATTNQYEEVEDYLPGKCQEGEEICSYSTDREAGSNPGQVPSVIPLDEIGDYEHLMTQLGPDESQYDFNN